MFLKFPLQSNTKYFVYAFKEPKKPIPAKPAQEPVPAKPKAPPPKGRVRTFSVAKPLVFFVSPLWICMEVDAYNCVAGEGAWDCYVVCSIS